MAETKINANQTNITASDLGAIQNTATGTNSLTILGDPGTGTNSINIGTGTTARAGDIVIGYDSYGYGSSVVVGYSCSSRGSSSGANVVIGTGSYTGNNTYDSIAVGEQAIVTQSFSIQLGGGTNNESGTFCVGSYYNNNTVNYKLLDANGTIPEARLADTTNAQQGDVLTLDANGDAVWQAGGSGGGLPSQTGNAGKFLTTDGTDASWGNIIGAPMVFMENSGDGYNTSYIGFQNYYPSAGNVLYKIAFGNRGPSQTGFNGEAFVIEYVTPGWGEEINFRCSRGTGFVLKTLGGALVPYGSSGTIGDSSKEWTTVYTTKINNGSDITVPNQAGTMVVATPPSADGTYVLKATVSSGTVTYQWVAE